MILSEKPMQFELELKRIQFELNNRLHVMTLSVLDVAERLDSVTDVKRYRVVMKRLGQEIDESYKDLVIMLDGVEEPLFPKDTC